MLRGLVLLFIGINVALYFWIDADPRWGQSEREPERLARQVAPASIQVLPDVPGAAVQAGSASGTGEPASAASPTEGPR